MVKIREYKIMKHGRGVTITLPRIWLNDNELDYGDMIDMYRDMEDRLIIVPKGRTGRKVDQAEALRKIMGEKA